MFAPSPSLSLIVVFRYLAKHFVSFTTATVFLNLLFFTFIRPFWSCFAHLFSLPPFFPFKDTHTSVINGYIPVDINSYTVYRIDQALMGFLINHSFVTVPAEISIIPPASTSPSYPLTAVFVPASVPKANVVQTSSKESLLGSDSWLWTPTEVMKQIIFKLIPRLPCPSLFKNFSKLYLHLFSGLVNNDSIRTNQS